MIEICRRCGHNYVTCQHTGTNAPMETIAPEHAKRIRAAYELGRLYNPDHDTTSYEEQTR